MVLTVLQAILGLGFIMFGLTKFTSKEMVEGFKHFGYSAGFRIFTGTVEIVAAVLLIAGIWNGTLTAIGSFLVVATMIGAIFTHIKIQDTLKGYDDAYHFTSGWSYRICIKLFIFTWIK